MACLIPLDEKFRFYSTVLIQNIRSRVWDAFQIVVAVFLAVHRFVADSVGVNRLAAFVRQERERDFVFICVGFEGVHGIVADRDDLNTGFGQCVQVFLQLDQLLLTVGSPIGRAVEYERDGLLAVE